MNETEFRRFDASHRAGLPPEESYERSADDTIIFQRHDASPAEDHRTALTVALNATSGKMPRPGAEVARQHFAPRTWTAERALAASAGSAAHTCGWLLPGT